MRHELTIAVANLQSGIGSIVGYTDYLLSSWKYLLPGNHEYVTKAAAMLLQENADVALLTEVNEISFRSQKQSHITTLKRELLSVQSSFFPTIKTGTYIHEGNAILSAHPISSTSTYPLPSFFIPRVLGKCVISISGTDVSVFVAHLSLTRTARSKQIKVITDIMRQTPGPIILGGDFNERDISQLTPLFHSNLSTVHYQNNFPSWNPKHTLDYLFLSEHFSNTHCYIPQVEMFSDHAPIIIKTELC